MKYINKRVLLGTVIGFLVGLIFIVALRFIMYKSDNVHYHANFALYVNGKRDEFKSFTFYEEVQACTSDKDGDPKHRVHMHDQKNDLIHVHAPAVTWGHFFGNLGYTLGDKVIKTDSGIFENGKENNNLTFILNGQKVENIQNRVIQSKDRLLINYGNDNDKTLKQRSDAISNSADEANVKNDPASCSGSEKLTFIERLKKAVVF